MNYYHISKLIIHNLYKCSYKQQNLLKSNGLWFYTNIDDIIKSKNNTYLYNFSITNNNLLIIDNYIQLSLFQ